MSYLNLHLESTDGIGNKIGSGMKIDWSPGTSDTHFVYYVCDIWPVQLKMFVPPGTMAVYVVYNCQYNTMTLDDITTAGRLAVNFGKEITSEPLWSGRSSYDGRLIRNFTEIIGQNGTNMSLVLRASDSCETEGEWLYIWVVNYDNDTSHNQYISSYVVVDKEAYSDWYYKANWDDDGNPTDYGNGTTYTYEHLDPFLTAFKIDPNAVYPQPWPIPYPWDKPFPYPFRES